jgi:hypothetical protein
MPYKPCERCGGTGTFFREIASGVANNPTCTACHGSGHLYDSGPSPGYGLFTGKSTQKVVLPWKSPLWLLIGAAVPILHFFPGLGSGKTSVSSTDASARQTPVQTVERYYALWNQGDFATMYRMLSGSMRASHPLATYVRTHKAVHDPPIDATASADDEVTSLCPPHRMTEAGISINRTSRELGISCERTAPGSSIANQSAKWLGGTRWRTSRPRTYPKKTQMSQ